MPNALNVLVCGATGNQGGAVARVLLDRGHRVKGLTRDPSKPAAQALEDAGAALAAGDLTNRSDCERVLEGVDAAFLVATPYEQGTEAEVQQGVTFAEAAASTGLRHLVYSSVAAARDGTAIPQFDSKLAIERRIEELGIPHTFVAPVYFMENIYMPDSLAALRDGRLVIPMAPDTALQQIAVVDVARFVALALENHDLVVGRRIEIAGDELTGHEAAAALGETLGREVEYVPVPLEAVRAQSEGLAMMFRWFGDVGFSVDIDALRRDFPDVGWRDFRSWASEQDFRT